MLIKEVDFPEALISAQQENKLVIFAGAGVSIPAPSNYPNFEDLAKLVSGGTLTSEEKEPIDHFLGRLEKNGVDVHRRTKEFLSDPESKPGQLHTVLLNIFKSLDDIRLVTTNFDSHFTTVAATLFKKQVEIYNAPALPLGYDFSGIVYLHGSVDKKYNNLVLTDSDFGKAYLTDGWATTFLKQLFQKYTVLFIGYSHNDLVMRYLSRGLPVNSINKRYALTSQGNKNFWNFLNIIPVIYPSRIEDRHGALRESLIGWAEFSKMGVLEHKQKIQNITSSIPPVDLEEADYIAKDVLTDPLKTNFFIQYAKGTEWLSWLEEKSAFQEIFKSTECLPENSRLLAQWLADNFICEHTDDALAVIQRKGQKLSFDLWYAIARKLYCEDTLPAKNDLAKIVNLLIQADQYHIANTPLNYLLIKLRLPEDKILALLLFEYLSSPSLTLRTNYFTNQEGDKVYHEVNARGDNFWLKKSWEEFMRPNLHLFAHEIEKIITNHLLKAHYFLRAMDKADSNFDHISFGRPAIEPHSQNEFSSSGIGVLIDPARDVIEWLLENDNVRAEAIIRTWFGSDAPILRRLALHGIAENKAMKPNSKIRWLLKNNLLFDIGAKHEIFRIIQLSYSGASDHLRKALIEYIISNHDESNSGENELREYQIYNLLVWINKVSPSCELVKNQLGKIQAKNPEFSPREHPDFSRWMSSASWTGPRSPVSVEELLKKNPETELDFLLNYKGDSFNGPDRQGLLATLVDAVIKSPDWSWKLVFALKDSDTWDTDIWSRILQGWTMRCKSNEVVHKELEFMGEHLECFSSEDLMYLSEFLKEYPQSVNQIPPTLPLAENIALEIEKRSNENPKETELNSEDWLARAINQPGGKIALFWIHALSLKNKNKQQKEISLVYKHALESILSGTSTFAMYGRVVLASQVHFLFHLDSEWTRRLVIPLFNWDDRLKSQQAWHGFIYWGRVNEELLQDIRPLFEKTFSHLSSELKKLRVEFCEHLAYMGIYGAENPVQQGWLLNFVKKVEVKDLASWSHFIARVLNQLSDEAKQDLWNKWIKEYWKMRISGVPFQMHSDESKEMIEWPLALAPVFEEAVDLICESPNPKIEHTQLFHNILESNIISKFPNATAKFFLYILQSIKCTWYNKDLIRIYDLLEEFKIEEFILKKIKDEMARLGC